MVQCATLDQKRYQNSKSIMFHNYRAHSLRQAEAHATWLFGMLKKVLKDRQFNSTDEIEEAITKV
jgi:hypothetical protein